MKYSFLEDSGTKQISSRFLHTMRDCKDGERNWEITQHPNNQEDGNEKMGVYPYENILKEKYVI